MESKSANWHLAAGARYDIVLYGATGFLGRQLFAYLIKNSPKELRWAIAGRNQTKLEALSTQGFKAGRAVDILLADSHDQPAVEAMVAQARIIVNTTGPYSINGALIVDACVRLRRHYIDATGETPWVRDLIDRYHERAAREGTLIIPCCGFASAPSDLGVYLAARTLQNPGRNTSLSLKIKAYYRLSGGVSGGTLASGYNLHAMKQADRMADHYLLTPEIPANSGVIADTDDPAFPYYDPGIDSWVGPLHHLGRINTRVTRRSADIFSQWGSSYGPEFSYQEFEKFEGFFSAVLAASTVVGMALIDCAMRFAPTRRLMASILRQPGDGPSERKLDAGWFQCEILGLASDGKQARLMISDCGDPGVRTTAKILAESALTLVAGVEPLPNNRPRGGVLTPATALGERLIERLGRAGMRFQTLV